jgi:hypothetical protein
VRKIFGVGLHRVGSQSLHALLLRNGINSLHWPKIVEGEHYEEYIIGLEDRPEEVSRILAPVIDRAEAVLDVPICAIFAELGQKYPEAKFIALRRSPSSWIASVRKHIGNRDFDPFERCLYWRYFPWKPKNISELEDAALKRMFYQHYRMINRTITESRLLSVDLRDTLLSEKITHFIGLPFQQFPRVDYLAQKHEKASALSTS